MRNLSGNVKKAIVGLVIAIGLGAGGQVYAGTRGSSCSMSCGGCTYTLSGCDACATSGCYLEGVNCTTLEWQC